MDRWLERADSAARRASDERAWTEVIRLVQRAVELYKGPFLGSDTDAPWAVSLNDRLRRRLLRQLIRTAEYWEHAEDLQQAADVYEEGLRVDPCADDVCRRLMTVYHNLGRPAEIRATYHRCQQALTTYLGSLPSPQTEALFKRLSAS
jgi:DNA-binding SARP family transcriptional activator